jgi:hypothetical protein
MGWEAITALSTAFTGLVILVTALVGANQLAQMRAQRRDAGAVELVRSIQDRDFTRAFALIISLPAGISGNELRGLGPDYIEAAQILAFRFEMLGVLVYRGAISFDITEDLVGGAIVSAWLRLKNIARETREVQGWPMYLEWFQWVAEQLERRGRLQQTPAHERYREWSPRAGGKK